LDAKSYPDPLQALDADPDPIWQKCWQIRADADPSGSGSALLKKFIFPVCKVLFNFEFFEPTEKDLDPDPDRYRNRNSEKHQNRKSA